MQNQISKMAVIQALTNFYFLFNLLLFKAKGRQILNYYIEHQRPVSWPVTGATDSCAPRLTALKLTSLLTEQLRPGSNEGEGTVAPRRCYLPKSHEIHLCRFEN